MILCVAKSTHFFCLDTLHDVNLYIKHRRNGYKMCVCFVSYTWSKTLDGVCFVIYPGSMTLDGVCFVSYPGSMTLDRGVFRKLPRD